MGLTNFYEFSFLEKVAEPTQVYFYHVLFSDPITFLALWSIDEGLITWKNCVPEIKDNQDFQRLLKIQSKGSITRKKIVPDCAGKIVRLVFPLRFVSF